MALADYYERTAQAVSQVLAGFDDAAFREKVQKLHVGVAYGRDAAASPEGRALLDLLVRLLARFYPTLSVVAPDDELRTALFDLAVSINPAIAIECKTTPTVGIAIGREAVPFVDTIYAGSDGWRGHVGTIRPYSVGSSREPFGPGIAACLAAGLLFRRVVLEESSIEDSDTLGGAALDGDALAAAAGLDAVLVGCGAIGNAAAWALARANDQGVVQLVDPQLVELSNLQRYVLTRRADENAVKTDLVASYFTGSISAVPWAHDWRAFVNESGYDHRFVAVALDSAQDRRAVQASLPEFAINAWTQPGDLGVSAHGVFGGDGACISCLYMPDGTVPNEDEIYAKALGVPERLVEVRTLLHQGGQVGKAFVGAVAVALNRAPEVLEPFATRPIRDLYVRGICGGAVLPLGATGQVLGDVHVPLAHQSALAGVLLAARLVELARGAVPALTAVTQIDVLRPVPPRPTHEVGANPTCVCRDPDFRAVYGKKWPMRVTEGDA